MRSGCAVLRFESINIRQSAGLLERTPHVWRAWTIEDRDRPKMLGARFERINRPSDWIGIVPNTAPKLLGDIVCEEFQGVK